MSSADLLRRAAVKLREHATAVADADTFADGVPWTVEDDEEDQDAPYIVANITEHSTVYLAEGFLSRAHADFVALLHPPVALALADLLNLQAVDIANAVAAWERDPSYIDKFLGGVKAHAENMFALQFALARAILREPEETRDA